MKRVAWALGAALLSAPALAADWREIDTPHFEIVGQSGEADMRKFAVRLEQFHSLLGLATGADETRFRKAKVRVYLVPDIATVRKTMGASDASNVAGYYSTLDSGAYAVVPRSTGDGVFSGQLVLFHEYAHHFMLQYTPAAYPSWYVEGFAEIASTASFERKGEVTFGKAASHRQYELTDGTSYSVAKMLDGSYLTAKKRSDSWSYGDAWALSHYLTFDKARAAQFRTYLGALNSGRKPADAAQTFGDLQSIQRAVNVYLSGGSFPYRAVPVPELPAGTMTSRMLRPVEIALIEPAIEIERRTRLPAQPADDPSSDEERKARDSYPQRLATAKADRAAWLNRLEQIAGQFPNDPFGWSLLADARCASEQYAECAQAARKSLALAPNDSHATARRAEADLFLAKDLDGAERTGTVRAAQDALLAANAGNPDDPLPLLTFYNSFRALGRAADKDGLAALISYVQLVPQAQGPRLMLGRELLSRGAPMSARRTLAPLAFSPHDSGASAEARRLIDQIDAKATTAD